MKKITNIKQNLHLLPVIIQDTTVFSPKYFNVMDMPEKLTLGINTFWITADNINLVENSDIYIEVLDIYENPIYVEFPEIVDVANKRLVSIYIYDDTPAGSALISIVGTAKKDSNGNNISNTPNNVRWAKRIDIIPNEITTSPIIFKNQPTITISEVFKNFTSGSYFNGSTINLQNSDMEYILVGNSAYVETKTNTFKFNKEMIGNSITFVINSNMYSEPTIPDNKNYTFTTYIKNVISENKLLLNDPIIIDTEKTAIITSPVWQEIVEMEQNRYNNQNPDID